MEQAKLPQPLKLADFYYFMWKKHLTRTGTSGKEHLTRTGTPGGQLCMGFGLLLIFRNFFNCQKIMQMESSLVLSKTTAHVQHPSPLGETSMPCMPSHGVGYLLFFSTVISFPPPRRVCQHHDDSRGHVSYSDQRRKWTTAGFSGNWLMTKDIHVVFLM